MTISYTKKICLAGKNQIAVDALLFMIERGWKDQLMVCPNITDSGASTWQPSLLRFARTLGVEVVSLETAQETEGLVFISLEFDRIIKPAAFRSDRLYNIHFSALPAYKGMYTSALPLLHGATKSGVTLHEIDSGIDTGPIIAQTIFDLSDTWTARNLYFAYLEQGLKLFRQNCGQLLAAKPPQATPQSAKGSTYYSKDSIDYANPDIILRDTADGIIRQLRAFSFREYQTPVVEGMEVGGWGIMPDRSREKPGTILEQGPDCLTLATIDYRLRLTRAVVWDWFGLTSDGSAEGLDPAFIDVADRNGWTALIRAAFGGKDELCRRLLNAGANPNLSNMNGTTPLMYAASSQDVEGGKRALILLLQHGANPDQVDRFGRDLMSYHPITMTKLKGTLR